ncbi:lysophospholipid acyltransferase family protein [candidate division KSB1 bacterium]|nr:lysophospholipid acyltransferase family protein [candidate division KSB1 bacterium]
MVTKKKKERQYKVEYHLVKILGKVAQVLPLTMALWVGRILGDLFYYVIKIRKEKAFQNLKASLGHEKTDKELKRILRDNYRHFGLMLIEFARFPLLNRELLLKKITVVNQQTCDEAFSQNSGLLFLSGHFGNWEILAGFLGSQGRPLHAVFKEQKNSSIDRIIREYREKIGLIPIKVKGEAARGTLRAFNLKASVLIVMDQDAGGKGEFIDFFGRPASTNKGPALIALKTKVPVYFAFCTRTNGSNYNIYFEKFPDLENLQPDEEGINQFLVTYNKVLERYISKYPEQWFWMHRRWKTQRKAESKG